MESPLSVFLVEADLCSLEHTVLSVFSGLSRSPGSPMGEAELHILSGQEMFKTNNFARGGRKY